MKVWQIGAFAGLFATLSMIPYCAGADPADAHPVAVADSGSSMAPSATGVAPVKIIKMGDDDPMYQPNSIQIVAGQTLEWQNTGQVSHSVTDDATRATRPDDALLPKGVKPFNSGSVMPGGSYHHTFTVPGRYRYFCLTHEMDKMVGEVLVEPAPPSGGPGDRSQPWRTLSLSSSTSGNTDP